MSPADEDEPEDAVSDVEEVPKSKKKKKAKKSNRESRTSKRQRPIREVSASPDKVSLFIFMKKSPSVPLPLSDTVMQLSNHQLW